MTNVYIAAAESHAKDALNYKVLNFETIECDNKTCLFNPRGVCLAPILLGRLPEFEEDYGCREYPDETECIDYIANDYTERRRHGFNTLKE